MTMTPTYPDLAGTTVCVTGAARGLGLAITEAYLQQGANALLLDTDADALGATAAGLARQFPEQQVRSTVVSVTDADAMNAALEAFTADHGPLGVMVNNAGISANLPSRELPLDRWRAAVDVNLTGVFIGCQAAAAVMRSGGVIINMSSMYGVVAVPARAAYCATKAAVVALTKVLAVEWAADGIRVNAIGPGYVATDLVASLAAEGRLDVDLLARRTPRGRIAEPSDVAAVAVFLGSQVSANITGQVIVTDGGFTADGFGITG